jgi:hypothetical protein
MVEDPDEVEVGNGADVPVISFNDDSKIEILRQIHDTPWPDRSVRSA